MQLVVKVDLTRAADPVAHVTQVLRGIDGELHVEEVFPGERDGASAGLVVVSRPGPAGSETERRLVETLQADAAIVYVQQPGTRRPR